MKETIAAVVVNDLGQILPYTVQSTKSQCEENAAQKFPAWPLMKEKGAKVVQCKITIYD